LHLDTSDCIIVGFRQIFIFISDLLFNLFLLNP